MTIHESNRMIIRYLAEGKLVKQVADILKLKQRTVEKRIYRMRQKYNCSTATELVVKLKDS